MFASPESSCLLLFLLSCPWLYLILSSHLTQFTPSQVLISPAWVHNSLAVLLLFPPGSSFSCTHTPDSALSLRGISYLTQLPPSQVLLPPPWVYNSQAVLLLYPPGSSCSCTHTPNSALSLSSLLLKFSSLQLWFITPWLSSFVPYRVFFLLFHS